MRAPRNFFTKPKPQKVILFPAQNRARVSLLMKKGRKNHSNAIRCIQVALNFQLCIPRHKLPRPREFKRVQVWKEKNSQLHIYFRSLFTFSKYTARFSLCDRTSPLAVQQPVQPQPVRNKTQSRDLFGYISRCATG